VARFTDVDSCMYRLFPVLMSAGLNERMLRGAMKVYIAYPERCNMLYCL